MKHPRRLAFWTVIALAAALTAAAAGGGPLSETFVDWSNHPAIAYKSEPSADPVAELNRRIQSGQVRLQVEGPSGYLRSVLAALNIPVESQIAVFAKDSVQASRITSTNPRTLFFNDSVAVGWVRGGFIELAAQDPRQGVHFYTLDSALIGLPSFNRRDGCLTCHYSYGSAGVPGMLTRSALQFTVNHGVPLEKRWGGWYVTGNLGSNRHLGNIDLARLFDALPASQNANWLSLDGRFDTSGYLTAHSDIVALMVFEHQMHMMNLLTRIGWEARVIDYRRGLTPAQLRANGDDPANISVPIEEAAKEVVDYMLFVGEAPFADMIRGSTSFAETFAAGGPADRQGRSLRQLDLKRRLLKYPCSYLIYSAQFEALPQSAKDAIYRRMWQILSGQDKGKAYARLDTADRAAIVDILRDTKRDVPSYFR
jgi:hypothetical protein